MPCGVGLDCCSALGGVSVGSENGAGVRNHCCGCREILSKRRDERRDEDEVRIVVFRERRRVLRRRLQEINRHHSEVRRTLEQNLQAVESRRDLLARLDEREWVWQ